VPTGNQLDLERFFPYPQMRRAQREALEFIARHPSSILELTTGTGKTAVGYTWLKWLAEQGASPLFYICPTKTLVDQVASLHPDVTIAYGRSEHQCLYYPEETLRADEIPCLTLVDCPHRVNQQTGETLVSGAQPCPYYAQKFGAKQSRIVVCTMAFYLFTQLFSKEWPTPAGLVIDEAHDIARVVRGALSYEITDYHLERATHLLATVDQESARLLDGFRRRMVRQILRQPAEKAILLQDREIESLIEDLNRLERRGLTQTIIQAVRSGQIDPVADRETLKALEVIVRDVQRYIHSLEFSLPTGYRQPLNYAYAYYRAELQGQERVKCKLVIKAHYVAPIIRKILSPQTVAYSATIGNPKLFSFETGIEAPFFETGSDFPVERTRIFLPTDARNLALKKRKRGDLAKTLRQMARASRRFSEHGHRSLIIVVSEDERQRCLELCREEGIKAVSYGNGTSARHSAADFKEGSGDVLVGTTSHYSQGVDLPGGIAPVIFLLRPAYPRPDDPGTLFEMRRFGKSQVWSIWTWRLMNELRQARGRNIRSEDDRGVTFLMSRQYDRFAFGALPKWLEQAFRGGLTFDQCVKETISLLE